MNEMRSSSVSVSYVHGYTSLVVYKCKLIAGVWLEFDYTNHTWSPEQAWELALCQLT